MLLPGEPPPRPQSYFTLKSHFLLMAIGLSKEASELQIILKKAKQNKMIWVSQKSSLHFGRFFLIPLSLLHLLEPLFFFLCSGEQEASVHFTDCYPLMATCQLSDLTDGSSEDRGCSPWALKSVWTYTQLQTEWLTCSPGE